MGAMATIARHRTAMTRSFLSRPLQQAHADGLLDGDVTVFDYGCGRGDDVRTLTKMGFDATGWDPAHQPDATKRPADIVNLGYVVNVIEDPSERAETLDAAWRLTGSVLIVSARLDWDPASQTGEPFRDGRLTSNGTFQKFYAPEELRDWITNVIGQRPITAAPGIYYLFRDDKTAQSLLARQSRQSTPARTGLAELIYQQNENLLQPLEAWVAHHRRLPSPTDLDQPATLIEEFGSIRAAFALVRRATGSQQWTDVDLGRPKASERRFAEHIDDLEPLMDFLDQRGRLPRHGELPNEDVVNTEFGSPRAAFSLIRRVTNPDRWEAVEAKARANFLVYVALSAFGGRPRFSDLPHDLQYDAKDLFGSYRNAVEEADKLLYSIADTGLINQACGHAPVGKQTPDALYVHISALSRLPALLRVYQGAARALTGNVDDATIVKLHRLKPQVSFLMYPTFDTDPHPALEGSIIAQLDQQRLRFRNYTNSDNPPILHRKETFLADDHPLHDKFQRLTKQEENAGLLADADIGRRRQWQAALDMCGKELRGHRLVRRQVRTA